MLNKDRFAWSRLVVAAYVRSNDKNANFAKHLASERCRALGDALVRAGIEPRRLETRAVVIPAPVLLDPSDDPMRYNQAVEIMALDR